MVSGPSLSPAHAWPLWALEGSELAGGNSFSLPCEYISREKIKKNQGVRADLNAVVIGSEDRDVAWDPLPWYYSLTDALLSFAFPSLSSHQQVLTKHLLSTEQLRCTRPLPTQQGLHPCRHHWREWVGA